MNKPLQRAVTLLLVSSCSGSAWAADDWQTAYKLGDRVELHISGPLWQQCTVTENIPESVLRGMCEEFVEAAPGTYRRAGGTYILYKGDVRPAGKAAAKAPRPAVAGAPSGGSFPVGARVEIEASNHWVPCVVDENAPPAMMRVRCEAYPKLSRAAGVYMVDRDNPKAVRKPGAAPVGPAAAPPPAARPAGGAGLKVGEYACYGAGGRTMAGLGFKVLDGSRFVDLDGTNAGTFTVSGETVTFRGGHLAGQAGRELRGHNFRLGAQATCEPF